MKESIQPICLVLILAVIAAGDTRVWAQDEYHAFSNKEGVKIEASIVSVSNDWKTMKIRRRDGQEFAMQVALLSLDDQQYVKNWIKENPIIAEFNLDVTIEKKTRNPVRERDPDDYYRFKTDEVFYRIEIKNLTRETLIGATAEYVFVLENRVGIYRYERGRAYSYDTNEGQDLKVKRGSAKIPDLKFAYSHEFNSEPLKYETIIADGVNAGEDRMVGAIVRVIGPKGAVIGEYRSSENAIQDVLWDQLNEQGGGQGASGETSSAMPELPDWLEVRELDSLPELLQKGDTIVTPNLPKWGRKQVRISAMVDIDEDNSGGTIVACGGRLKGFSLFVLNDALHFWVRKLGDNEVPVQRGIQVPISDLPSGQFKVAAEFKPDTLKLWIDDSLKAEGESFGLIVYRPQEGLSVGYDSENGAVGGAAAPHPFRGTIQDVRVKFGGSSFD